MLHRFKINEQLRLLENPEHTEWQIARADNEVQARALLKSINDFLRRKVEELASENGQEDFDVAGLAGLLPDDPGESRNAAPEDAVTDRVKIIEKQIPKKKEAHNAGSSTGGTESTEYKEGGFIEGDSIEGYLHNNGRRL